MLSLWYCTSLTWLLVGAVGHDAHDAHFEIQVNSHSDFSHAQMPSTGEAEELQNVQRSNQRRVMRAHPPAGGSIDVPVAFLEESQTPNTTDGNSTNSSNLTDSEALPEEPKDVEHAKHKAAGAFVVAIIIMAVVAKRALTQRKQFADASRELLPSKSVVVVTGFMLKTAISLTLLSVLLNRGTARKKEGTGDANASTDTNGKTVDPGAADMAVHFITFLVLLATSIFLSQFVKKSKLFFEDTKKLYVLGLALIPAWAWKDFVSHLITVATNHRLAEDESLHKAPPVFNMILALVVIIVSASLQTVAEMATKSADDESSLVFLIASTVKQCLGLGAGFSVNNIFKTMYKDHWTKLWFQGVYGFIQISTIPFAQRWITRNYKDSTTFGARILKFCVVAGNFVIGWAVKGLLDAFFHGLEDDRQLLVTLIVSTICIAAVTSASTVEDAGTRTLINTAAAMNIGWTWTDWISGLQASQPNTPLWAIWLDMFIISGVMLVIAWVFEKLINWFHPPEPDPEEENAGEDGAPAAASQQPEQAAANDAEQLSNEPDQKPAQEESQKSKEADKPEKPAQADPQ